MNYFAEYGLFVAKWATVIGLLTLAIIVTVLILRRAKGAHEEGLEVTHLNRKYEDMDLQLQAMFLPAKAMRKTVKKLKAQHKAEEKQAMGETKSTKKKVFVLEFKGDVRASQVTALREEITAVLMVAGTEDEIVVQLESGGGVVHGYGLAASQLQRFRNHQINLTIIVDKIAASGGYMMACVANQIIAAPFAIIGSIGVVAQLPNFHRVLQKNEIDYELITAGEYKRTLTLFGENTDKAREKFREDVEETHVLFKQFICQNRPSVDIDRVATGEHWYGTQALDLKLVDKLQTSDDYLYESSKTANVYKVKWAVRKTLMEKVFAAPLTLFKTPEVAHGANWEQYFL